jgi:REP element-mobilizing transposase RayT
VGFHHVNTRRNVDQLLFVDDADRLQFLAKLEQTVFRNRWLCHGYCLMSNHYHLLIETPEHNLGAGMLLLNGMYARYFNWRQETVGHVFQGPYHDESGARRRPPSRDLSLHRPQSCPSRTRAPPLRLALEQLPSDSRSRAASALSPG